MTFYCNSLVTKRSEQENLEWRGLDANRHLEVKPGKAFGTVLVSRLWQVILLHLFWQAPLEVHSAKRRRKSPEWTILSHVSCFIQGELTGFQVLLDSLHPRSTRAFWWSPPVLQREAVKIFLASVSSGIRAMWPNREKHYVWTIGQVITNR